MKKKTKKIIEEIKITTRRIFVKSGKKERSHKLLIERLKPSRTLWGSWVQVLSVSP